MLYKAAAELTVVVHFLFILFVIFGVAIAWNRPVLKWAHWVAMGYGVLVEVFNWYCPLTLLEGYLRRQGGWSPYEGSFLARHLKAIIYVDLPQWSLVAGALVVVLLNAALYIAISRRHARHRPLGSPTAG